MEKEVASCLIAAILLLGLLIVSNVYTIGRVLNSLIFSQRTHLQRAVAKHDLVQSEGYLQVHQTIPYPQ